MRRDVPEKGTARCVVKDPLQWLETLYDCCRLKNSPNPAVDFVLDGIDELLRERRLGVCNQILMLADVDRLSIRAMLALLMETFRAKGKLDSRSRFYERVEGYLQRVVPEQAALKLAGLE